MKKSVNNQRGSALVIVLVAVVTLALIGALGYFGFNALQDKKEDGTDKGTTTTESADGKTEVKQEGKTVEAFGIKLGMKRADVEKVLGEPMQASKYLDACSSTNKEHVSTLGYDTTCSYQVGEPSTTTYLTPATTVKYLDGVSVEAVQTKADGTITSLTKEGLTTISSKE